MLSDELLKCGHSVRFQASGVSMYPTILDGDIVIVEPATIDTIGVGDVVLSSNRDKLLVHRVVELEGGRFRTRGDSLAFIDESSDEDRLLGRVVAVEPMRPGFELSRMAARTLGSASIPAIRRLLWGERARRKLMRTVARVPQQ